MRAFLVTNASYAATAYDETMVMFSTNGAAITNTLPAAPAGKRYTVKRCGTNNVVVTSTFGFDIPTNLTYSLEQNYQSVTVVSDGERYHIIGEGP